MSAGLATSMHAVEKATAFFQDISSRNAELATEYVGPGGYVEHDPAGGVAKHQRHAVNVRA